MIHSNTNPRQEAILKLKYFLKNPGYFAILLIGENGVGKEFYLKQIIKEDKELKNKVFKKFFPFEIGETEEEMKKIFVDLKNEQNNDTSKGDIKRNVDIIFIKDIENLTDKQQNLLFKAMITTDGTIGFDCCRAYRRIIFSSSYDIELLRENKEFLTNRFWDRISQLVVKIPSFKEYSSNIINDFKSVWERMNFNEYNKLPEDGEFIDWLKNNCKTFTGNFRDLEKIAILWHQYRIILYDGKSQKFKSDVEARIFRKVRNDFERLVHFPIQKEDTTNTFVFEQGKTWEQIDREFKAKFKAWAKKTYGTIKRATKELNMPPRKMDKW